MNISVQIARIAKAKGCPPYHIDYLKKDDMADIASCVLPEVHHLLKINTQLLAGLQRAEQTLRGLGHGELKGDVATIMLNEAANLRKDVAAATGGE